MKKKAMRKKSLRPFVRLKLANKLMVFKEDGEGEEEVSNNTS